MFVFFFSAQSVKLVPVQFGISAKTIQKTQKHWPQRAQRISSFLFACGRLKTSHPQCSDAAELLLFFRPSSPVFLIFTKHRGYFTILQNKVKCFVKFFVNFL